MKYTLFNVLVIAAAFLLYQLGLFKVFSSSYLFWGVIFFIIFLFIVAIKVIGIPHSKE